MRISPLITRTGNIVLRSDRYLLFIANLESKLASLDCSTTFRLNSTMNALPMLDGKFTWMQEELRNSESSLAFLNNSYKTVKRNNSRAHEQVMGAINYQSQRLTNIEVRLTNIEVELNKKFENVKKEFREIKAMLNIIAGRLPKGSR